MTQVEAPFYEMLSYRKFRSLDVTYDSLSLTYGDRSAIAAIN